MRNLSGIPELPGTLCSDSPLSQHCQSQRLGSSERICGSVMVRWRQGRSAWIPGHGEAAGEGGRFPTPTQLETVLFWGHGKPTPSRVGCRTTAAPWQPRHREPAAGLMEMGGWWPFHGSRVLPLAPLATPRH